MNNPDYDFKKYEDEDWPEKDFLTSLNHLLEVASKDGTPVYVLEGLLSVTSMYLEFSNITDDKKLHADIVEKFGILKSFSKEIALKSKLETFEKSMAIGQFIEILIYHGLPRIAAIEASAEWLEIGKSTARIHNENFRKIFDGRDDRGRKLIRYISLMYEQIKKEHAFPSKHPKSKKAFEKTKEYYQARIRLRENLNFALETVKKKFRQK